MRHPHTKVTRKATMVDPYRGRAVKTFHSVERKGFASGGSVQPRVSIKVTDPDHARAQTESKRIAKDYGYTTRARGGPVGMGNVSDPYLTGKGSPWSMAHKTKK